MSKTLRGQSGSSVTPKDTVSSLVDSIEINSMSDAQPKRSHKKKVKVDYSTKSTPTHEASSSNSSNSIDSMSNACPKRVVSHKKKVKIDSTNEAVPDTKVTISKTNDEKKKKKKIKTKRPTRKSNGPSPTPTTTKKAKINPWTDFVPDDDKPDLRLEDLKRKNWQVYDVARVGLYFPLYGQYVTETWTLIAKKHGEFHIGSVINIPYFDGKKYEAHVLGYSKEEKKLYASFVENYNWRKERGIRSLGEQRSLDAKRKALEMKEAEMMKGGQNMKKGLKVEKAGKGSTIAQADLLADSPRAEPIAMEMDDSGFVEDTVDIPNLSVGGEEMLPMDLTKGISESAVPLSVEKECVGVDPFQFTDEADEPVLKKLPLAEEKKKDIVIIDLSSDSDN
ncbi:hypothetical protein PRIPAC_74271 [Pristionchus pacificus]|nr:hypothetical protein PRIPAC_74271 [Pristionchus pacificus]